MLNRDFKELLSLFNDRNVEYIVVGGYAVAIHGHPLNTGDFHIWIDPTGAAIQTGSPSGPRTMPSIRRFSAYSCRIFSHNAV
jgi:hypothetical protein